MDDLFEAYLSRSDLYRKGYSASLLPINVQWASILNTIMKDIPDLFQIIYSRVSGTRYGIKNQALMDFIPGYLLIHIDEYVKNYKELQSIVKSKNSQDEFYPVLRNYSSDFIALKKDTLELCQILHDDFEIEVLYENPYDFLKTLNANYERKVYFLDDDGYLDYDADLEYEVAEEFNPDVEFWREEEDD